MFIVDQPHYDTITKLVNSKQQPHDNVKIEFI
jgi:hypothetical protein